MKNYLKIALIPIMFLILFSAGCSILFDLWPTPIPKDTAEYIDKEPNQIIWPSIGVLKEFGEQAITKNITKQLDLAYQMNVDKAKYDRAVQQANINIQNAESERKEMIGTIGNPGWLLGLLLGGTGFSAYLAGARKPRPEDWTDAEVKALLVEKGVKDNTII
jgi:hypothetical protein